MSKNIVISPHPDDAIFSLGNYIQQLENVAIITPLAGIPADEVGKAKHTVLNAEHAKACAVLGVDYVNGDFLDDVYPGIDTKRLRAWIQEQIPYGSTVYAPMGIHHPDHKLIRNILGSMQRVNFYYAELPYRVLYPVIHQDIAFQIQSVRTGYTKLPFFSVTTQKKREAVECYKSQLQNDHIRDEIYVEEFIYG